MKRTNYKTLALASAGLLGAAALLMAEETPKNEQQQRIAEFEAQLLTDDSAIENPGQVVMSYADVVQRILPSVVSISTYSKSGTATGPNRQLREEDLESLPPMFRDFFRDYLEKNSPGSENAQPKGRQRQRQNQQPVQTGLGSGFLLTSDGYILTNNHVVDNADEVKVTVGRSSRQYVAKVIGKDPSSDVALIKIDGTDLPRATLGDSSKLRVGDVVLAVGSPMGLDQSVTQGIISAMGRTQLGIIGNRSQAGYEDFIQTDAAINPGNSGGPLVDAKGRVIGINTAIETRSGMFSGIGLAIPVNMAVAIAVDLMDDGKVDRGFLGIQMDPVDASMADFLGLDEQYGVTVTRVVEGSPADKAGFQGGDVVVSADGQVVEEPSKLRLLVSSKHAGQSVNFDVIRFNEKSKQPETIKIVAVLEKLEPDKLSASYRPGEDNKSGPAKNSSFLKGVEVADITATLREEYSIGEEVEGILVTSVDADSPAGRVGLQEGDVITQVDHGPVSSVADARKLKSDPGTMMLIQIIRDGQTKFLPVKN